MFFLTVTFNNWWEFVLIIVATIIVTAIATYFITRTLIKKELKKNPPVNEQMIRMMYAQMGRTPSEKQVRAVMRSMNEANK